MDARKQNLFADIDDFIDKKNGFETLAVFFSAILFVGAWIACGNFWGALILTIVAAPMFSGMAALFIACVSMMFSWRAGDQNGKCSRLSNFLIPLPGAIMSGAMLYVAYLIAAG